MSYCPFLSGFYLFVSFFYRFSACGASDIFKELQLPAPAVFAAYHQRYFTGVAFFAAREDRLAAKRAERRQIPPAPGAYGVAPPDFFYAGRAVIAKRASARAFWAEAAVALDHFAALHTGLLVCSHYVFSFFFNFFQKAFIICYYTLYPQTKSSGFL
jgi:hypothetical protein